MFFSVVIPTHNRAETLNECLEALYHQSLQEIDYEVIVVDDESTDLTEEILKIFAQDHANFRYFKQAHQWQGAARNLAISKAKGEVILMIGDDIIPTYDLLYEHQKFHYLHPEENAAVLGFTAWHPKLKINRFMQWMVNGSSLMGKFGGHQFAYEKLRGKELADYNFFYTSNISLKRSLLKKFPFDPKFAGYGWEDIDLGYRLEKEAGLKLYYNSWAIAYHDHYMEEDSLQSRMMAIGKAAWIIQAKHPELQKVPGFFKKLIFSIIGSFPMVWFWGILKKISSDRISNFYYYILSKRYFLKGLSLAKNKYV